MAGHRCTEQTWRKACGDENWIEIFLSGRDVTLGTGRSTWKLFEKVGKEKVIEGEYCSWPYATAVFHCLATSGPCKGRREIMKIHMQLKGDIDENIPTPLDREIDVLEHLANAYNDLPQSDKEVARNKLPAPYLLEYRLEEQPGDSWMPEGFLVFIVMRQKLGHRIDAKDFWARSRHERDEMRTALLKSNNELLALRILHGDPALRNLLWVLDEGSLQCNIVDFEGANILEKPERTSPENVKMACLPWGLTDVDRGFWFF